MRVGDFSIEVFIKGKDIAQFEYFHAQSARTFVEGIRDSPYTIKITNYTKKKYGAKLYIDGQYKGSWNLIKPRNTRIVKGFCLTNCYREFVFSVPIELDSLKLTNLKQQKNLNLVGTITCYIFSIKERDKSPTKRKLSEPRHVGVSKDRSITHMGLVTKPGRDIPRKKPSYKYAIASNTPISALKMYYADHENLLSLKTNSNIQDKIMTDPSSNSLSTLMYDDISGSIPYFTSESNLLETFSTPINSMNYPTLKQNFLEFEEISNPDTRSIPFNSILNLSTNRNENTIQAGLYTNATEMQTSNPLHNGFGYTITTNTVQHIEIQAPPSIVISLRCFDRNGEILQYRILKTTPMSSLVCEYCSKRNINPETVSLQYKGTVLNLNKTISQLGIQDGDTLELYNIYSLTDISKMKKIEPMFVNQDLIFLKVRYKSDSSVKFRMKKIDPLSKLFDSFCKRKNLEVTSVKFMFGGAIITPSCTPTMLSMNDDDINKRDLI